MNRLDEFIAAWRERMFVAGIKKAEVLDELEGHLREEAERRIRSGVSPAQAFLAAVHQMGQPEKLKAEFKRIESEERKYMKRGLIISAGIIGVLIGMAFVMPAVAQYQHEGAMKNDEPWLFLLGALLTLGGFGMAFRGMRKSRA